MISFKFKGYGLVPKPKWTLQIALIPMTSAYHLSQFGPVEMSFKMSSLILPLMNGSTIQKQKFLATTYLNRFLFGQENMKLGTNSLIETNLNTVEIVKAMFS